jgi:hypothetical protein
MAVHVDPPECAPDFNIITTTITIDVTHSMWLFQNKHLPSDTVKYLGNTSLIEMKSLCKMSEYFTAALSTHEFACLTYKIHCNKF